MFKKICLILVVISSLDAITVSDTINQRNLFEKQKDVFKEKEQQKKEDILHYNVKKPKIEKIDGGKCFNIKEIKEVSFTLLSKKEKSEVYNEYLNKCNTLNDIKNLINKISSLYIDKGYVTSKVYLKAQNIKDGILILHALEGKIEDIKAKKVEKAIENNRTETWLVNVMPDGSSNIKVLDVNGKSKNIDTSNILLPNANYNGVQL